MDWGVFLIVGVAAWAVIATGVAIIVGKAIRVADER